MCQILCTLSYVLYQGSSTKLTFVINQSNLCKVCLSGDVLQLLAFKILRNKNFIITDMFLLSKTFDKSFTLCRRCYHRRSSIITGDLVDRIEHHKVRAPQPYSVQELFRISQDRVSTYNLGKLQN